MKYNIGDEIRFHRASMKSIETGTILESQEMGEHSMMVYTVKITDSATIVHITDPEIIHVDKYGLIAQIDMLSTL